MLKALAAVILLAMGAAVVASGSGVIQSAYALIQNEGSPLARETVLNFEGAGVDCVAGSGKTTCTISGGGGSAYATVQNEATPLTQRTVINFIGTGVDCVDDAGNSRTNCTIDAQTSIANYQQSFTAQTSVTLTHNMNSSTLLVQCFDGSNVLIIPDTVTLTNANNATVTFLVAQTGYCNVNGTGGSGGGGGGGAASSGTFAALPSPGNSGALYRTTDAPYTAIDNGSAWTFFASDAGSLVPPGTLGGWTWDNQGSSTIDASKGVFQFSMESAAGPVHARVYSRSFSGPRRVRVFIKPYWYPIAPLVGNSSDSGYGVTFRDATGKLVCFYNSSGLGAPGFSIQKWTSTLSYNSDYLTSAPGGEAGPMQAAGMQWFELYDDGTLLHFSWSLDGQKWNEAFSVSRTDFMASGPTEWGVFSYVSSGGMLLNVVGWTEGV